MVSKPSSRKGKGQFCNWTYLPWEKGLKETQIPLCDNSKKYCTGFFLEGIRTNELSPTKNVPYLFFPNANMVSTGDKTQLILAWNRGSVDQNKICRHHGRGLTSQSLHQFIFLFSGRLFLCFPPGGACIDTTTTPLLRSNTNAWRGESTSRLQKTETRNAGPELMVCFGCLPTTN